jgi:hypothetical protein
VGRFSVLPSWLEEEVMVSDLECETTGMVGSNCIIADLETIAPLIIAKKGGKQLVILRSAMGKPM